MQAKSADLCELPSPFAKPKPAKVPCSQLRLGMPLLDKAFEGYNATIFAYGCILRSQDPKIRQRFEALKAKLGRARPIP